MKNIIAIAALVLPCSFSYASDLVVDANAVLLIDQSQQELQLDSLRIGDNARIEFAPGVDHWYVDALDARIGNNVTIDGRGRSGRAGVDGAGYDQLSPRSCKAGRHGEDGIAGENGLDGIDVRMRVGLSQLGSVTIDTSGGAGGNGGNGGNGQNMDALKNCKGGDGGNGGRGGDGGSGGHGGNLRLSLWSNNDFGAIEPHLNKITAISNGGDPGRSGQGGNAGDGSAGSFVIKKSLTGDRKWEAGGDKGKRGTAGADGEPGRNGNIELEEDTRGRQLYVPTTPNQSANQSAPANSQNKAPQTATEGGATDSEIEALRKQLMELQRRLDQLEGAR